MKNTSAWKYAAAVGVGLAVGWADTHMKTDDIFPSLVLLGVPTVVFGAVEPWRAWRWGLLVGAGIPLCHLVGLAFGYHAPYPVQPNVFATFLALLPALAAGYAGALLRLLLAPAPEPAN